MPPVSRSMRLLASANTQGSPLHNLKSDRRFCAQYVGRRTVLRLASLCKTVDLSRYSNLRLFRPSNVRAHICTHVCMPIYSIVRPELDGTSVLDVDLLYQRLCCILDLLDRGQALTNTCWQGRCHDNSRARTGREPEDAY